MRPDGREKEKESRECTSSETTISGILDRSPGFIFFSFLDVAPSSKKSMSARKRQVQIEDGKAT